MTDPSLADPIVSPEIDLRDFGYMPLDVVRLRDSDLAGVQDGEVFRAAVLSWCVAWHQQPAASLPDDDAVLARLLGYGRDVKGWLKLREQGALRGYVKCNDGRLYHPVVAEKAIEAWQKKSAQRNRTEAARLAREQQRLLQQQSNASGGQSHKQEISVTDNVTESKGREGKGREVITPPLPPSADAKGGPPPANGHDLLGESVAANKRPKKPARYALREGWYPNETTIAWLNAYLADYGLSGEWAQRQHDLFIGKAKANAWAYADWDQAYKNFIRENGPGGRYYRDDRRPT